MTDEHVERLAEVVSAAGPLLGTDSPEAVAETLGWRAVRHFGGDEILADTGVPGGENVALRYTTRDGRRVFTEARMALCAAPDGRASVVDAFADAAATLRPRFGRPTTERPGARPTITWQQGKTNGSGRLWRRRYATMTLETTPDGRGVHLAVRTDDEADRLAAASAASAASAQTRTAASPARPDAWADGDWDRFTAALTAELADLEPDHVMIVADRLGGHSYVQFIQFGKYASTYLGAETISDHFRDDDHPLTHDQRRHLADLGWEQPLPGDEANWSYYLEWPARWDAYHRLAGMTVVTLRDVHGVRSPADLEVGGWGYDHAAPPPYPRLGLPFAPPV